LNRYTLKVRVLDNSVTADSLRLAIDNILLRVQPSVTYRLGQVASVDPNHIFAEISSDGGKDFLELRLKSLEAKLPVAIEKLGWGWIIHNVLSPGNAQASLPEMKPVSFLLGGKIFPSRYILVQSLTLMLVVLLIGRFYLTKWDALEWVYYAVFMGWIILLNETPLDFRLLAKKIDCDPTELIVTYWFRKKPVRLSWDSISGLRFKGTTCFIDHQNGYKPIRFHISNAFKGRDELIETITRRASLNDVETGISRFYKRYEAP
jgi:hypothetical protein